MSVQADGYLLEFMCMDTHAHYLSHTRRMHVGVLQ